MLLQLHRGKINCLQARLNTPAISVSLSRSNFWDALDRDSNNHFHKKSSTNVNTNNSYSQRGNYRHDNYDNNNSSNSSNFNNKYDKPSSSYQRDPLYRQTDQPFPRSASRSDNNTLRDIDLSKQKQESDYQQRPSTNVSNDVGTSKLNDRLLDTQKKSNFTFPTLNSSQQEYRQRLSYQSFQNNTSYNSNLMKDRLFDEPIKKPANSSNVNLSWPQQRPEYQQQPRQYQQQRPPNDYPRPTHPFQNSSQHPSTTNRSSNTAAAPSGKFRTEQQVKFASIAVNVDLTAAANDDSIGVMVKPSRIGRNRLHDHKTYHHLRTSPSNILVSSIKSAPPVSRVGHTSPEFKKRNTPRNDARGVVNRSWNRQRDDEDIVDEEDMENTRMKKRMIKRKQQVPRNVLLPEAINVANFAKIIGVRVERMTWQVENLLGINHVTPDYVLTAELAALVAAEIAPHINTTAPNQDDTSTTQSVDGVRTDLPSRPISTPEEYASYPLRAPVVTIMGHVDHGKTTLLDALRNSSIAASEAGGITQHIGAFEVVLPSQGKITFLDTPGHSAFENMRARGAQVTDIVVLVVAADDGVMPQTIEAIKHAHAAEAPIIVAVNKCDKPGVDAGKVKHDLLRYSVQLEEFGGDVQAVEISALKQTGLDQLEEAIVTLSEVLDLRGDHNGQVEGVIIESKLQKGKGNTATVLVKQGTLKVGDTLVAGTSWCRVRSMNNEHNVAVLNAPPSTPIEVLGWKDLPGAGDRVLQANSEDEAKMVVEKRLLRLQRVKDVQSIDAINERRIVDRAALVVEKANAAQQKRGSGKGTNTISTSTKSTTMNPSKAGPTIVPAVIKGDVSGSVEAVVDVLKKITHDEVQLSIVHTAVGPISESDIELASAVEGIVIGFNVRADKKTQAMAKQLDVTLHSSNIIYRLIDDIKKHLSTLLAPEIQERIVGEATVAQVFALNRTNKAGGDSAENVAGCKVSQGKIAKNSKIRLLRDNVVLWEGTLKALKSFKKDVNEVSKGNECGLAFEGFELFKEGDVVHAITTLQVARNIT